MMARKSASSSASSTNGHLQPLSNLDDHQAVPRQDITPGIQQERQTGAEWHLSNRVTQIQDLPYDSSLLPDGRRSLSSIGLQAFALGSTFALCSVATVYLASEGRVIWRLPAFFACLSLFHFLEFWTTAKYNMPATRASSFLLRNGKAYTFAHGLASTEMIASAFFPSYQSFLVNPYTVTIGVSLVICGQLLRSAAMAEAGTNFNHTPAKVKKEGHDLVVTGVYAWLRHPSYCAFFWWALGTQIMVGNKISLIGYTFVLWHFFRRRIRAEERTLVEFFGDDYEQYRKRTTVGIPLVK